MTITVPQARGSDTKHPKDQGTKRPLHERHDDAAFDDGVDCEREAAEQRSAERA
ncbi:hypothetical protein [Sinorhizobium terangae]|uniref:hypothetical protein n=1 Tax=Sinorhizobium terangae TaxID=110322 RepID=UPI0031FE0005